MPPKSDAGPKPVGGGLVARWAMGTALVGSAAFFCACSARVPATHYYVLESRAAAVEPRPVEGAVVGVHPFRVDAPYDQDRIVYRVGGETTEVGFYAYHRWAAPLSRMVPGVVAEELNGASGIRLTEPVAMRRDYDYLIDGRVLVFEEVDDEEGPTVRVRLELRISDAEGSEIWSGPAGHEMRVQSREVETVAAALRAALRAAISGVRAEIAGAIAPEPS